MNCDRVIELAKPIIKKYEGLKLNPYLCPAGLLTIGYGHVILPSDNIKKDGVISPEQAEDLLERDIKASLLYLNKYVQVELNDYQAASLVSFIFNNGVNAFKKSTLLRLLNKKDFTGASNQFIR